MNWIKHPVVLVGNRVRLLPLKEAHFNEICKLGKDISIWKYSPIGVYGYNRQLHLKFLEDSIGKRISGEFYPFIISDKVTNKIIGFTAYNSIRKEYRGLEIGATWFHPRYWSKNINTECKYLMLEHCFETLKAIRVQFKTNDNNKRSRKAIEKVGGKFEGIFRKDKILEDGTIRNAAYYSIIDDEWVAIKAKLEKLILK